MSDRAKKIWIGFLIAMAIFVYGVHRTLELKVIKASKNVEGGEAVLKEYLDGNIGFTEFFQRVSQMKPKPAVEEPPPAIVEPAAQEPESPHSEN